MANDCPSLFPDTSSEQTKQIDITTIDPEFGRKNSTHQNSNILDNEALAALQLQNPAQILPNLYLSSETPAKNLTLLKQLHINYILNLTGFKPNTNELRFKFDYPSEFTILHIPIADEMNVNIFDHIDQALRFISNSIDNNNNSNKILIHCEAGISRSSTIVIAYLMQYHHKSLKDAYDFVKQCKNNVDPNINFFKQLIQFEKQINNNNFQSSFNLHDYLVQYMLQGPAAGFSRDQILEALEKTNNDTHAACNLLFSTM